MRTMHYIHGRRKVSLGKNGAGAIILPVAVYSAAHFLVDFSCAFFMFRALSQTASWAECILLYNFCAFAMQMPLGLVADRLNRNALFAAAGCLLVAAGYALPAVPIVAAVVAGLGNGMFHVGAGVDVLNHSTERSGALGVFVSPGAFGIYLGGILGRGESLALLPVIIALVAAALAIVLAGSTIRQGNVPLSLAGASLPGHKAAILCLFLVVCLRSFVGMTLSFPWKGEWHWGVILTCAVVLGKTAGGFFADRVGMPGASLVSLLGAAVLFLFGGTPIVGVLAIFLFNMTMPVTLWAVAKILPGAKGFAFGLLTFGLFLGFLPVHLGWAGASSLYWVFALLSGISALLLLLGLRLRRS